MTHRTRVRRSTAVTALIFIVALVTYILVRPETASSAGISRSEPVTSATTLPASTSTTRATTTTAPSASTSTTTTSTARSTSTSALTTTTTTVRGTTTSRPHGTTTTTVP